MGEWCIWDLCNSSAVKNSEIWKFNIAAGCHLEKSKYHHVTIVVWRMVSRSVYNLTALILAYGSIPVLTCPLKPCWHVNDEKNENLISNEQTRHFRNGSVTLHIVQLAYAVGECILRRHVGLVTHSSLIALVRTCHINQYRPNEVVAHNNSRTAPNSRNEWQRFYHCVLSPRISLLQGCTFPLQSLLLLAIAHSLKCWW